MELESNVKKKKGFFQRLAELSLLIYLITLYIFVDRIETLAISQWAFLIFAGFTILAMLQKKRLHIGKGVMTAYLTFVWMFASYFWAENQYVAWVSIKTMWKLFAMFFLTYNLFCEEENAHNYLLLSLYIAGISLIGYSIYTYGLSDVIKSMSGSIYTRLGKEINQENTFGMMNATTCMVAFYYLFYKRRFKLFHIVAIAFAFLFAMASGSRKALLIICIGVLLIIYKKFGIRQIYKILAILIVLVIVFASVIQLPVFDTINHRMEGLINQFAGTGKVDGSTSTRLQMIKDGWSIYKERIVTGFGLNNFRIVSRYGTYAHNNFIEILADIGLIGFLLYYTIYWNVLKNLWSAKNNDSKALLCIFLVRFMMEIAAVTYYDKVHWILIAFFLMKTEKNKTIIEGKTENEDTPEKTEESYT